MSDLKPYLQELIAKIDAALDQQLPSEDTAPETIHKAMRYSIFAGGKRLRPVVALAAAEALGASRESALMMMTYAVGDRLIIRSSGMRLRF